jgi:hypothetical protein
LVHVTPFKEELVDYSFLRRATMPSCTFVDGKPIWQPFKLTYMFIGCNILSLIKNNKEQIDVEFIGTDAAGNPICSWFLPNVTITDVDFGSFDYEISERYLETTITFQPIDCIYKRFFD